MQENTVAGTAADPTVRFTKVDLNGKTYQLVYDFDAIAQAEDMTGLPLLVGVNWQHVKARQIRAMLFASLLKAQPDIKLKDVTKLITVTNLPMIERALVEAWVLSTPDKEEATENPQQPEPEPAKQQN